MPEIGSKGKEVGFESNDGDTQDIVAVCGLLWRTGTTHPYQMKLIMLAVGIYCRDTAGCVGWLFWDMFRCFRATTWRV